MSLWYRILKIEYAIPFEDVVNGWRFKRDTWIKNVIRSRHSAKQLAASVIELLDALTPASISYFWPDSSGFTAMRNSLLTITNGEISDPTGAKLEPMILQLEEHVIPPPPAVEQRLMGNGKPLTFKIGDNGPVLKPGDRCGALDIRMMWCKASVVGVRYVPEGGNPPGGTQYRIHYEGWKPKWDEWVDKESGRVAAELPGKSKNSKQGCASFVRSYFFLTLSYNLHCSCICMIALPPFISSSSTRVCVCCLRKCSNPSWLPHVIPLTLCMSW